MKEVLLTALGVGGATLIGSVIGFIFKNISHKFSDIVLGFAAGVMLSAAVLGLIVPSLEQGGKYGIIVTVAGVFVGALCLNLIDKLVPHLHKLVGPEDEKHHNANLSKVLLFVMAIEMVLGVEIFRNDGPEGTTTLVPIVFPLIAGAGSFTTLLSLRALYSLPDVIIALLLNIIIVYLAIRFSVVIERVLGKAFVYVLRKFFGVILLAMSVRMFVSNFAKFPILCHKNNFFSIKPHISANKKASETLVSLAFPFPHPTGIEPAAFRSGAERSIP